MAQMKAYANPMKNLTLIRVLKHLCRKVLKKSQFPDSAKRLWWFLWVIYGRVRPSSSLLCSSCGGGGILQIFEHGVKSSVPLRFPERRFAHRTRGICRHLVALSYGPSFTEYQALFLGQSLSPFHSPNIKGRPAKVFEVMKLWCGGGVECHARHALLGGQNAKT